MNILRATSPLFLSVMAFVGGCAMTETRIAGVTGIYYATPELSAFEPCDRDEIWRFDIAHDVAADFEAKRVALRRQFEEKYDMSLAAADTPFFILTASGKVEPAKDISPAGLYDQRLTVTEFTAFRLSTPEEDERCAS